MQSVQSNSYVNVYQVVILKRYMQDQKAQRLARVKVNSVQQRPLKQALARTGSGWSRGALAGDCHLPCNNKFPLRIRTRVQGANHEVSLRMCTSSSQRQIHVNPQFFFVQKSIFVKTAFPSSACLCLSGLARFDSCCLEASALASENRHMLVFQGWTAGALRPATPICQSRPTCTCKSVYVYCKKKHLQILLHACRSTCAGCSLLFFLAMLSSGCQWQVYAELRSHYIAAGGGVVPLNTQLKCLSVTMKSQRTKPPTAAGACLIAVDLQLLLCACNSAAAKIVTWQKK